MHYPGMVPNFKALGFLSLSNSLFLRMYTEEYENDDKKKANEAEKSAPSNGSESMPIFYKPLEFSLKRMSPVLEVGEMDER
jgi:hypothetical protein